jgi:hypothetical protein
MIKVAIITDVQKDEIIGQFYNQYSFFGPVKDCNDNWILTEDEISQIEYSEFDWIKVLPLIDFCVPVGPPEPPTE